MSDLEEREDFGLEDDTDKMFIAMRELTKTDLFKEAEDAARRAGFKLTINLLVDVDGLARRAKPG